MAEGKFEECLASLQSLGLLVGRQPEAVAAEFRSAWESWESHSAVEAEVMLATLDHQRVWHRDLKFSENPAQIYPQTLYQWSQLLGARFEPQSIEVREGMVCFQVEGYSYAHKIQAGHYLDTSLAEAVNSSLYGTQRFEVCDNLGMPNLVIVLNPASRAGLEERGWNFVSRPQSGEFWGFLSTFWEQGMEEPPWHIFQDRAYCDGPDRGWDRAGLHQLAEGSQLRVFDHDYRVLWSGQVKGRRQGWFGRLNAGSCDWHPREVPAEVWRSYFNRNPPLRALYQLPRHQV